MEKFKHVTKEEFDDYLANYPRDLETRILAGSGLPIKCHCDFSDDREWPQGVVAKVRTDDDEVDEYFVLINETTLIYSIDDAEEYGETRNPQDVIQGLGIKYYAAWIQTQDDEIKINGVDPDTVPDPLPAFLRAVEAD